LSKATTWCAIMFMVCALALVLRTDKAVEQGGSVLQKVSKPAKPAPAPRVPPTVPSSAPASEGQPPVAQPPAQVPPSKQPTPAPTAPKKP
jgi:hypothetical protein